MRRLKSLEDSQRASVDSTLQNIRLLMRAPMFSKEQALDFLLTLSMVAKETKHAKAGYYQAVLRSMREKEGSADSLFKRYLEVLLGDKDQEKVIEIISKVDKSTRREFSANPYRRGRGDAQGASARYRSIECYNCHQFGHYQSRCPLRRPRAPFQDRRARGGRFAPDQPGNQARN